MTSPGGGRVWRTRCVSRSWATARARRRSTGTSASTWATTAPPSVPPNDEEGRGDRPAIRRPPRPSARAGLQHLRQPRPRSHGSAGRKLVPQMDRSDGREPGDIGRRPRPLPLPRPRHLGTLLVRRRQHPLSHDERRERAVAGARPRPARGQSRRRGDLGDLRLVGRHGGAQPGRPDRGDGPPLRPQGNHRRQRRMGRDEEGSGRQPGRPIITATTPRGRRTARPISTGSAARRIQGCSSVTSRTVPVRSISGSAATPTPTPTTSGAANPMSKGAMAAPPSSTPPRSPAISSKTTPCRTAAC